MIQFKTLNSWSYFSSKFERISIIFLSTPPSPQTVSSQRSNLHHQTSTTDNNLPGKEAYEILHPRREFLRNTNLPVFFSTSSTPNLTQSFPANHTIYNTNCSIYSWTIFHLQSILQPGSPDKSKQFPTLQTGRLKQSRQWQKHHNLLIKQAYNLLNSWFITLH